MATQTYCTSAEIKDLLSDAGALAMIDDDENAVEAAAETARTTAAIQDAAEEMNGYLQNRYLLSELASNSWCVRTNAILAAHKLSARRGNAPSPWLDEQYNKRIETLEDIGAGKIWAKVPGAGESYDTTPTVTNFEPQRASSPPILVDIDNSTGSKPADGIKRRTY